MELLQNHRKEVTGEENINLVLKREKLIELLFIVISLISQLLKALPIEKSEQHPLKVLLSDIDKNRHRV